MLFLPFPTVYLVSLTLFTPSKSISTTSLVSSSSPSNTFSLVILYNHIELAKRGYAKDGFFLRAESLYNVATNIDDMDKLPSFDAPIIGGYGGVSLHNQSHGESFLAIVQNRFFGNGLYILDEPEAALSPMKLLTLMVEINDLVNKNSQFIIATHSPILMAFPNAEILEFTKNGINKTRYQDTEHYKITKTFLDNPEKILYHLLEDK